ncbi:Cytosolic sulfotransferase 16 [Linum perenne]
MEATMSSTEDTNKLQAKEAYWDIGLTEVEGFWYSSRIISSIEAFRAKFKPKREDEVVILASNPKTGTTWLKALSHCILFRDEEDDLLIKMNPHLCVPYLDARSSPVDPVLDKEQGRLFNTHLSYSYLPDSIKNDCKLVYITRDPKDTLVSHWHFFNKIFEHNQDPLKLERAERAVESFCSGMVAYGPFYEHVLEYWEQSNRSPDKVMFIKFEDLHYDPKPHVRKLAAFLGRPFRDDESDDEEVEKVIWRSSFDRLKDLDVNKNDSKSQVKVLAPLLKNSHFFRRGKVGDWRNHLTMEMVERIDNVTRMKLQGTGLYTEDEQQKTA